MKTIADDLTSQFGSVASFEPLDNDSIRILYDKDNFDDEINEVLKQAGVKLDEDESCLEQSHDEEDGEIDPKTKKEKTKRKEVPVEDGLNVCGPALWFPKTKDYENSAVAYYVTKDYLTKNDSEDDDDDDQ